jgi:CDP-diacylglycerol---serine O-phosphatidyltransferase
VTAAEPRQTTREELRPQREPWSLVRSLTPADVITLVNAISGTSSVLATLQYAIGEERRFLWLALALLPIAGIADFMDGRVARKTARSSLLGGDLDSLSDLISFGVAPACLAFVLGFDGFWDAAVLVYFVCCGLGRLARYNATASSMADDSGKVRYYEGTPIPTSLGLVAVLAVLFGSGNTHGELPLGSVHIGPWALHPLVLLFLVSGSAMISGRLRVPKP